MTLSGVQVQRGVAESRLVVTRDLVRLAHFLPNPLARRFGRCGERVRRGGSIIVLLLVNGDVETLHAGVVGVSSHRDGHRFTSVDQPPWFTLLLVLHRHHVDLLFVVILLIFII